MSSVELSEECLKDILNVHEEELGSYPNVVGMGIIDGPTIAVYVREKVSNDVLHLEEILPQCIETCISGTIVEVPISVIEQGVVSVGL